MNNVWQGESEVNTSLIRYIEVELGAGVFYNDYGLMLIYVRHSIALHRLKKVMIYVYSTHSQTHLVGICGSNHGLFKGITIIADEQTDHTLQVCLLSEDVAAKKEKIVMLA